ncbi:hypothetical protein FNU76_04095 [Chitinimonas arctica]|uniref:PilN domain-containing protein n=1 Tax=Chitinimonas arctica TaxID=2594795 RepID=A0A516SC06_9NEIS|nr:hypothetical protein [Chitinimonas arctica]QDQ25598.1 hypothetical protein FNU76_04095 [Chitinimonas arctica]
MKRLQLDFFGRRQPLTAQLRQHHPLLLLLWALSTVALLLGSARLWQVRQQQAELDQSVQARLRQAFFAAAKPAQPVETGLTPAQIRSTNEAIRQLNLPWAAWFAAFEQAARPDVALLSITPNEQSHAVHVSAESEDIAGMLAYVAALQQSGFFTEVSLRKHRSNEKAVGAPVLFEFTAQARLGGETAP